MFSSFSGLFSRRSLGLSKSYKRRKQVWMQNYLSASDESAMGPLSQILKSEPYAASKERHIDCNLTPRIGVDNEAAEQELLTADAFQWPVFKDRTYSRFLKRFMFSFKNIYSENINCSNLMFVTGPTKCGKSVLLRQNMQEFSRVGSHVSSHAKLVSFTNSLTQLIVIRTR